MTHTGRTVKMGVAILLLVVAGCDGDDGAPAPADAHVWGKEGGVPDGLPPPKDGHQAKDTKPPVDQKATPKDTRPPPRDTKPPPRDTKPPTPDTGPPPAKAPTLADLWAGKAKWAVDQAAVPVKGGPGHREAFAVNRTDVSPTTIYLYHRCFAPKGKTSICLSVSNNGGASFQKYHGVIVAPDAGHTFAVAPAVAKKGSTWLMVYEESHVSNVYWAESSDGITWKKKGKLLKHGGSGKWDSGAIATPGILVDGLFVNVFYAGFPSGGKHMSIGYAWGLSMNLMFKTSNNPQLKPPGSGWDGGQRSMGRLVKEGAYYYTVYEGATKDFTCNKSNRYGWGMARSKALKSGWATHPKNPFGQSSQKTFGCGNDMPSIFRRHDGWYFVYHTSADTTQIVREKLVWSTP